MNKRNRIFIVVLVLLIAFVVLMQFLLNFNFQPSCTYSIQANDYGCEVPFTVCPTGWEGMCSAPLSSLECGETEIVCGDKITCQCIPRVPTPQEENTSKTIRNAILEENQNICYHQFQDSALYMNLCYFWLAKEKNRYDICDEIHYGGGVSRDECWTMAAVKNRDETFCYKINQEEGLSSIQKCLIAVGKITNDNSSCDFLKKLYYIENGGYDYYWSKAGGCYEQIRLFNEVKPVYDPHSEWCPIKECNRCEEMLSDPAGCDYDYYYYVKNLDFYD